MSSTRRDAGGSLIVPVCENPAFNFQGYPHSSIEAIFCTARASFWSMKDLVFKVGQAFQGRLGIYTLTKQLQQSVWVAR